MFFKSKGDSTDVLSRFVKLPISSSHLSVVLAKSRVHRDLAALSHWLTARRNRISFLSNPSPLSAHQPTYIHPVPSTHPASLFPCLTSTFHLLGRFRILSSLLLISDPHSSLTSPLSISFQVNLSDYMQCTAAMLRHQLSFHLEAWRKDYH